MAWIGGGNDECHTEPTTDVTVSRGVGCPTDDNDGFVFEREHLCPVNDSGKFYCHQQTQKLEIIQKKSFN